MATFRVGKSGTTGGADYFVNADTVTQARAVVARSVPEAFQATDVLLYYCLPDNTQTPPRGVILSSIRHTYTEVANANRT